MPTTLLAALPALLQETPETSEGGRSFLVPMVAIAAIFYFLMVLPEKKNRKKREELLAGLSKGDKVMMKSGLYGTIVQVQDERVRVQVADGVRLEFARDAISGLAEEGGSASKAEKGSEKAPSEAQAKEPAKSSS